LKVSTADWVHTNPKNIGGYSLSMIYQIVNALRNNEIEDIVTIGYLTSTSIISARSSFLYQGFMHDIFLRLHSNIYLNVAEIGRSDIQLSLVQVPSKRPGIEIDEDELCFGSIFRFFLDKKSQKNNVVFINIWCEDDWHFELGICKALELTLANGKILFFDPVNLDGLKLSNQVLRDEWLKRYISKGAQSAPYTLNLEEWPIEYLDLQ
jgi:hypothetical protein